MLSVVWAVGRTPMQLMELMVSHLIAEKARRLVAVYRSLASPAQLVALERIAPSLQRQGCPPLEPTSPSRYAPSLPLAADPAYRLANLVPFVAYRACQSRRLPYYARLLHHLAKEGIHVAACSVKGASELVAVAGLMKGRYSRSSGRSYY